MLARLSPPGRRVAVAALGLVALSIVASALTPTPQLGHGTHGRSASSRGTTFRSTVGVQRRAAPVSAAELARVRVVAGRFLESYLPFVYGRASAVSVSELTPALRRQLLPKRAWPTPVERRRHPRVVSLEVAGKAPGVVVATALVEDGGITIYPLRITLRRGRAGWLVSSVDEG